MKFIHAADVHLDSPLRGLAEYGGAPVERLRLATRRALENLTQLCLDERVDFLLIAGDLFDADCRDFNAALAAAAQMRRLDRARIPVYLILGNHDSRDEITRHAPWPDNVNCFDHVRPHTLPHPTLPVALHGMSYPKRELARNLVPDYPPPVAGCFNIGLLHTSAGGHPSHDPYAPCSVEELAAKGYDYWALGHVHERQSLGDQPRIVYPGNLQGRHARETGPKGCALVGVEAGAITAFEFRETDVVRWFRETIELEADDEEDALVDRTRVALAEIARSVQGRLAAVRLEYRGRCAVHRRLSRDLARQQIVANIRGLAGDFGDEVWIEKIKFRTRSPLDIENLRLGHDLVGQLLREIRATADDPTRLEEFSELLKPLAVKAGLELAEENIAAERIDFADPARLAGWLRDAENLLLCQLVEERT